MGPSPAAGTTRPARQAGIRIYVDLDGDWGEQLLKAHLEHFKAGASERFQIFGGVDWSQWKEKGDSFPEWAAHRPKLQKERGAQGLNIWKDFGLRVRDDKDRLASMDDLRLGPLWETAGELALPVVLHLADPVAFIEPLDASNERWEELHAHPEWHFIPPFPPFLSIVEGLANLVSSHPRTTFIGAHVGCYAENLAWVGTLLERCLNFYVDISARLGELGRQPYTARRFFLKYPDCILFGLDAGPDVATYCIYHRFLETDDGCFNYSTAEIPDLGRWYINGLYLPEDVLEKVYFRNAERILLHHS